MAPICTSSDRRVKCCCLEAILPDCMLVKSSYSRIVSKWLKISIFFHTPLAPSYKVSHTKHSREIPNGSSAGSVHEVWYVLTVDSLRLVSPAAATDIVTYFIPKKPHHFFVIVLCKVFFSFYLSSFLPLPPSGVVYPVFFLNSATTNNFSRLSPPGWCHPGRFASLYSDATAC